MRKMLVTLLIALQLLPLGCAGPIQVRPDTSHDALARINRNLSDARGLVKLRDGSEIRIKSPRVDPDSVHWRVADTGQHQAVTPDRILRMEVLSRRLSGRQGAIGGIVLGAILGGAASIVLDDFCLLQCERHRESSLEEVRDFIVAASFGAVVLGIPFGLLFTAAPARLSITFPVDP